MSASRKMIFHVPFRLNADAKSASGIRPVKMRQAFESIGYEVIEISGRHPERRKRMKEVRRLIKDGLQIDFVYSEAATTPNGLGEPVTTATSLSRDSRFLGFCRSSGIPVGLFYRDIYWQFDEYSERVGQPYASVLRWRYRADLRSYVKSVDLIYLPSIRMAQYLPSANRKQAAALPPGADRVVVGSPSEGLSLLYVGGTGGYYRMQETVRGVEISPEAQLTICTRENEWQEAEPLYKSVIGESTTVVHRSGSELERLYAESDIGMLLMEPMEYREFAAPMKMYEYIGHGKPIIATEGSLAGDFVTEHGIGWAIPYDFGSLAALLEALVSDRSLVRAKTERALIVREEHTWEARARQVVNDLMND